MAVRGSVSQVRYFSFNTLGLVNLSSTVDTCLAMQGDFDEAVAANMEIFRMSVRT